MFGFWPLVLMKMFLASMVILVLSKISKEGLFRWLNFGMAIVIGWNIHSYIIQLGEIT